MSTALQIHERPAAAPARQTLEPMNLKEAWEFAEIVAKSELAPKDYRGKPANIIVAIQFGKELGIPPMQALQGISVINGRPGLWGDLMWAIVTSHPEFMEAEEVTTEQQSTVKLTRKGRKPVTESFTLEDAKRAGLLGKDSPWKTYPKRMLMWRARTFAARTLFPDALKGMISAEEASDIPYEGGATIEAQTLTDSPHPTNSATTAAPDPVITQDQARDFGRAWKGSGYSVDEAKAWLKENIGVESSLKIPAARFDEAMRWAKTPKYGAAAGPATTAQPSAAAPTPPAQQEMSPEEKNCREAFALLDWNLAEQAAAIDEHQGDWTALLGSLNRKLSERDE